MGYYDYLKELLRPLGVYNPAGIISEAELAALGEAFDGVEAMLVRAQREMSVATAQEIGLRNRERLVNQYPVSQTQQQCRDALIALLQIRPMDISATDINRAVDGCGVAAQVEETEEAGVVRVSFPGTGGSPSGFMQMQSILETILPAHLEIEYHFFYQTWALCSSRGRAHLGQL